MSLADVDRLGISLAVARVVAHRLHTHPCAVLDHDVAVAARGGCCLDDLERILTSRHTVLGSE